MTKDKDTKEDIDITIYMKDGDAEIVENDKYEVHHTDSIGNSVTDTSQKRLNELETEKFDDNPSEPTTINPGEIDLHSFGKDFEISHPTEISTLESEWYLHYVIRKDNREALGDWDDRPPEEETTIEQEFDNRVIEYGKRALHAAGLDISEDSLPITPGYILALLIREVRALSYEDLADHLDSYDETATKLNFPNGRSRSKLSEKSRKLQPEYNDEIEDDHYSNIVDAAKQLQYDIYMNGHDIPKSVWETHEKDSKEWSPLYLEQNDMHENIEEGKPTTSQKNDALRNWAEAFLVDDVLDEINFDRADNKSYPFIAIIGLYAHAALQDISLTKADATCKGWIADEELVIKGSTVHDQINNFHIDSIARNFQKANTHLLELADDYGVFENPMKTAFDPTSILFETADEDDPWLKGYAPTPSGVVEPAEKEYQMEVGVSAITHKNTRLILGYYPIGADVGLAASFDRIFRPIITNTPVAVKNVTMDKGLRGTQMVDHIRSLMGKHWFILWEKTDRLAELLEETPKGEDNFEANIDTHGVGDLSNKPNGYICPIIQDDPRTNDDHFVFLTDYERDELTPESVFFGYRTRTRIEPNIEQIKQAFHIPTKNESAEHRFYLINISALLFNIYNLVNTCLSPKYGLPLRKDDNRIYPEEVLSAIREVAFEKAKQDLNN